MNIVKTFEQEGLIADGKFTTNGLVALSELLEILPPINKGIWGPVFIPFMRKMVPSSIEVIVLWESEVLLTYRNDESFHGWHVPGGYIGPDEDFQMAASRIAKKEIGCDVRMEMYIKSFLNNENGRFSDSSHLVLCTLRGKEKNGEWFAKQPSDLIVGHRKYWPYIEEYLL